MKAAKLIAYTIIVLLLVWVNYAFYKANKKDKPRLFKPTEEKLKEYIPNTSIKKPDFSLTDSNLPEDKKEKKKTSNKKEEKDRESKAQTSSNNIASEISVIETLEQNIIDAGLVDVSTINDQILVELKYSGSDNFLGQDVYGKLEKAYLQKEVAEKLSKAQEHLSTLKPSYKLLVYDAVRPRSVQMQMWEVVKGTPEQRYVASPFGGGSMHNYGASVDLTIADENNIALDMGTPFDFFGNESQPRHETKFLKEKKLNQTQIDNRKLLRTVMKKAGFRGIQSEWWHFNAFSKQETRSRFKIIE